MGKKLLLFLGMGFLVFALIDQSSLWGMSLRAGVQGSGAAFSDNSCVACHAGLTEPLLVSNRYLEWHLSRHREKEVGCDRCHGGNPQARDQRRAHEGVLKASQPKSRLSPVNQPETCGACHQSLVAVFTQSSHYQKLKRAGLGPTCNTCHIHMATKVVYSPEETSSLCANCHNTINGLLPPRPEIPEEAKIAMMAIQRADMTEDWTHLLLAEAQRRGLTLEPEKADFHAAQVILGEAKVDWHQFQLATVRRQADEAFLKIVKVRDRIQKRLFESQRN